MTSSSLEFLRKKQAGLDPPKSPWKWFIQAPKWFIETPPTIDSFEIYLDPQFLVIQFEYIVTTPLIASLNSPSTWYFA